MTSLRQLEQNLNSMHANLFNLVRAVQLNEDDFDKQVFVSCGLHAAASKEAISDYVSMCCDILTDVQDKKISGETPEVITEKLILAGQALLSQIADLKRQALLADFAALNTGVAQEVQTSLTKTAEGEAELAHTPLQEVRWLTFAIWQPGTMLCLEITLS